MQIRSATFVVSAASAKQFVKRPIPHFVFSGKSNVGKSSLLNKLLNRKSLAKTSSTPGKTRQINYFLINDRFFFVDLPGYGYAKVSKSEQESWKKLVEQYFEAETGRIAVLFQLVDVRHDPAAGDRQMVEWLRYTGLPFKLILTKADKLSRQKQLKQRAHIAKLLEMPEKDLILCSANSGEGIAALRNEIQRLYDEAKSAANKEEL